MSVRCIVPLAIGSTATGAVTGFRQSLQLPATLAPVQPVPYWLKLALTATGAGSATVLLEQSVDNSVWTTAATATISGTNAANQQLTGVVQAPYVRANVSAISGTAAALTVLMEYDVLNQ